MRAGHGRSYDPVMTEPRDGHDARLNLLDPLLPRSRPLPEPGPDDVALETTGGGGLARLVRADPSTLEATWNPAERHLLTVHVGGDDPVASMAVLLELWAEVVRDRAGDCDSAAMLTWPSRDVAMTRLFLHHGLAPASVLAIRPAGRDSPAGATQAVVRRATGADVEIAVALELDLVRWNQQLGQMTERPNTAELIRAKYAGASAPWFWLAEVGGKAVGLLTVLDPARTPWPSELSSAGSAAYLSDLMVTPGGRGAGAGAALVHHVHGELDRAGLDATVLHYLAMNPLSGPFWHRSGYRPLTTTWEARPAMHLR